MLSALHTRLCQMLGIRYPIIQTAMGWVATPELVAASCNAGAMGFLAAATIRPEDVEAEIRKTQQLTDRPFGVNFLMEAPGAALIVDALVRQRVKAASYSRSPKPEFIKRFKDAGILCIPTCGAARHAQKAVQLGADIVVVQGGEGGGHTGTVPTSLLVSQVVDLIDAPVVAAGGFRDGRGLVAALAFGAVGIAMGTRFLLTRESPIPPETAKRYLSAAIDDVLVTKEVDGMPHRVVRNELVTRLESGNALSRIVRALRSGLAYRKLSGASIRELLSSAMAMRRSEKLTRSQTLMAANAPVLVRKAMLEGDPVEGVLPSGSVAGVIGDIPSVAELIERIVEEAEQTLKALAH
ncbi:MAG: nitronate monooxygenase [Deltaproteobacteria bacterium]|nr:nitronate monooxygenase [Deltaproteobacteria bacterium]